MSVLDEPLRRGGLLCVEASAGTGKTHLLSTLATRWLVERDDTVVADLLVVTYTVAAAAELRGRVRTRLAEVRDRLVDGATASDDEYLERLAARDDAALVRDRAMRALATFDTATIKTVHAFAATALGEEHGSLAGAADRRRQAVADVLAVAAFDPKSALFDAGALSAESLGEVVAIGLDHPDVTLAPLDGAQASKAAFARRQAAEHAQALFNQRQRTAGVLTYADLLTRLDEAIAPDGAPALVALRDRYKVGLIDEFQDTDPTQWRIFSRIFLEDDDHSLVIVGDPKQAIYGFRGADVATYLEAKTAASDATRRGLGVEELGWNHRSDGALVEALNGVLSGTHFDEGDQIAYRAVQATPAAAHRRLVDADATPLAPLVLRVPTRKARAALTQRAIADECALEADRARGCEVRAPDGTSRPLSENDIVVLCDSRFSFGVVQEAFLRRGIRTTVARSDDVLDSAATLQVRVLLAAMADPDDPGAVAALAHSWFGSNAAGADAVSLARSRLASWAEVLRARGVTALGRAATDHGVTTGLLAMPSGERHLTDLQHLFDLLAASVADDAGPAMVLEALDRLRAAALEASDDDVRARRMDTDAPAVRLMTVHGAKGLEFGVVLCPFVQRTSGPLGRPTIWRDEARPGRLVDACATEPWCDDRLAAPTAEDRARIAAAEGGGEARRLLYVALTRAKHRAVVWWRPAHGDDARGRDELAAILLDRDDEHRPIQRPRALRGTADAACYRMAPLDALAAMRAHFAPLVASGLVEIDEVGAAAAGPDVARPTHHGAALAPTAALDISVLQRSLVVRERRSSFSSLVAGHHTAASTLDEAVGDARAADETVDVDADAADEPADPFDGLRGTEFGSAVHEALEAAVSRRPGERFDQVAVRALRESLEVRRITASERVAASLLDAARTPIAGHAALCDLGPRDAATELRFSLPVAAGVDLAAIARTFARHDAEGPFAEWWATAATQVSPRSLGATLVGSIDLVTTLGTNERYFVIDYKTNLVGTVNDGYGRDALLGAMRTSDYPLQAALYLVALHRYLRWRVSDYEPSRHLGGAHYLFVRGMRPGSDAGVCTWSPSGEAVAAASDLLAGR